MRLGSQSERPRAPNQALTRGNLSPRCARSSNTNRIRGPRREKGAPGRLAAVCAHGRRRYGKTTLLQEYELPVQTGARSDDLAEMHPTEGMTKVIPALSCKHDNEERRSGSDDYLARRQLLRQRGGFNRSAQAAGPGWEESKSIKN